MRWIYLFVISVLVFSACRPDEEILASSGNLSLLVSSDTVLFDTLLTDRRSITRRFRVYNPNKNAVEFDEIKLGKGALSDYTLVINGREGTSLTNEVLFGEDSLQILVSAHIDPRDENLPYLVKDSVVFNWNGNQADVKLVAYGQDAIFVNADTLCNVTWTSERPYVIYNYALVDTLCMLSVQPGAQVFLDNGAALFVKGSLQLQGTAEERITVKNTRFDFNYQQAPGQWDAIYFLEGSHENEVTYADITNGTIGLRVGTPDDDTEFDLEVRNSTIGHMSNAGILAFSSEVFAENTLIYNCGTYLVGNFAGGRYQYDHCTLVNTPNFFFREDPSVQFSDNILLADNSVIGGDLDVTLRNTIIWGSEEEELLVAEGGVGQVTKEYVSGILKSSLSVNNFFTSQEKNFPGFLNPNLFDYRLDTTSIAIGLGTDVGVPNDLIGTQRDSSADIGCYEFVEE